MGYLQAGTVSPVNLAEQKRNEGFYLLTVGSRNMKTAKGEKRGVLTFVLHLSPADISGTDVCLWRSAGCTTGCLNTAGKGIMANVQAARLRKTLWLHRDLSSFMEALVLDIRRGIDMAERKGMTPAFRLNGTSDILWERIPVKLPHVDAMPNVMHMFPGVQFYDYSKAPPRVRADAPANYHLTYSRAEHNASMIDKASAAGHNVAVVFRKGLPETWNGRPVVDGDYDDLRYLDPQGVVVGLKAKGAARKDTSGFVVDWS